MAIASRALGVVPSVLCPQCCALGECDFTITTNNTMDWGLVHIFKYLVQGGTNGLDVV